jgi:hypothetical protein
MTRVARCLCPCGHAILALAVADRAISDAELRIAVRACIHSLAVTLIPACPACGETEDTWHYDVTNGDPA